MFRYFHWQIIIEILNLMILEQSFASIMKGIGRGNGCHAQHSTCTSWWNRYKDELKHAWKETDNEFIMWLLGAVAATGKSSSFVMLGKYSLYQICNEGFKKYIWRVCKFLSFKILAQCETADKRRCAQGNFYVLCVAYRDTK